MDHIFTLLGNLIVLTMSFVPPIINLLFSVYQEGVTKLTAEFEADKVTQETYLGEKLKEQTNTTDETLKEIVQSIKQLKKMKKSAISKISYLENNTVMRKIFFPLLGAFLIDLFSFLTVDNKIRWTCLACISLVLVYVGFEFSVFLNLLQKVKATVDEKGEKTNQKFEATLASVGEKLELIAGLFEKLQAGSDQIKVALSNIPGKDDGFISDVKVRFGGVELKKTETYVKKISVNQKATYKVAIINHEDRMAKDIEAGFIVPPDLVVDNTGPDSLYKDSDDGEQIARFQVDRIHGKTSQLKSNLSITPLKKGNFRVSVFLKGENLRTKTVYLIFEVI